MAQLLLVSTETYHPPFDMVDDIIGVFDDKHKFSEEELKVFNVKFVPGTRIEIKEKIEATRPHTERVFLHPDTGEWSWKPATRLIDGVPQEYFGKVKEVYEVNGRWYFYETKKHPYSLASLTQGEKDIIEQARTSVEKDEAFVKITKDFVDTPEVITTDTRSLTPHG